MFTTYVGPITNNIIEEFINELKKKETKDKIFEGVINPLIRDISTRYYPYFILIIVVLVLIIVLLISILITMIVQKKNFIKEVE
jgi:hypothetical protein